MRRVAPWMSDLVMARKTEGLSQSEVGARIGLSAATISNLEAGENMRLPHIVAYAETFGLEVLITYPRKVTAVPAA